MIKKQQSTDAFKVPFIPPRKIENQVKQTSLTMNHGITLTK